MKYITYLMLVSFVLVLSCGDNNPASPNDHDNPVSSDTTELTFDFTTDTYTTKMISEINLARTNPAHYAEIRLKSYYESNNDNGAYTNLSNWIPVSSVTLNEVLCQAADKYAKYLADHNVFSHTAHSTPSERCATEGYSHYSGENLAAHSAISYNADSNPKDAAINFVRQLIIDEGVETLGHSINIMKSVHKVVGVGFHRNTSADYNNYCVQNFGSK